MEQVAKGMTAVERAKDYGIDISLLESHLALTPTERLIGNQNMLALAEALAKGRQEERARRQGAAGPAHR